MTHILFTCAAPSSRLALNELKQADPAARLIYWLTEEIGLAELELTWQGLTTAFLRQPPIFIRHICPAFAEIPLAGTETDLPTLAAQAAEFAAFLDRKATFSIQTRLAGEAPRPYGRFEINNALAEAFQAQGFALDVRAPEQIISVVCAPKNAYLGFSNASENLSNWAGGEHRFKAEPEQVSRAEFKLLEALDVFHIQLPAKGHALDLGAAPGGWTRILAQRGLRVTAIDPANLHPAVLRLPGVTHVRKTVQETFPLRQQFDVILNDMRMDTVESVRILALLERNLKPGGVGLMTLKLPEHYQAVTAHRALTELGKWFTLRGARQLFHNRSEITAAFEAR